MSAKMYKKPQNMYNPKKSSPFKRLLIYLMGMKKVTMPLYVKVFYILNIGSKLMRVPILGTIYKRVLLYDPSENAYSHSTVLNLNVDVSEDQKQCVLPIDLVKKVINDAEIIASTPFCICRQGKKTDREKYPQDVCCLFFSDLAKTGIKNGVAYEISKEKALERVDKAAKSGLVAQALWVQLEQYLWGVQDMHGFFEICFCCPCCCVAINNTRYGQRYIKEHFTSSGWQAIVNDNCIKCGECISVCPQEAITMNGNSLKINNDYCFGCAICKTECKNKAIEIKQVKPMKNNLLDYFKDEGKIELHI
ncbi:MAG: 4Fe-4S binding protein [Dehalobacterium sp.]